MPIESLKKVTLVENLSMPRRKLRKTRSIIFAIFGFVICGAAFAAIPVLVQGSSDPEMVSQTLGRIGGAAGGVGMFFLIWSLFVKNDSKTE